MTSEPNAAVVESLMRAARHFAGVTAESLAQAEDVSMPQLRVLVLASRRPLNNTAVATALDVHLSNATRMCDRLVQAGLLNRRESKVDRRNVELTLTEEGTQLVAMVMDHRRAALVRIMQSVPVETYDALASALNAFSDAAEAARAPIASQF